MMRLHLVIAALVMVSSACHQAEGRVVDSGVVDVNAATAPPAPASVAAPTSLSPAGAPMAATPRRAVEKTTAEWQALLPKETFHVMFEKGTERPFCGGGSWNEHRKGVYRCAACNSLLFTSDAKFDSGTGWPSFKGVAVEGAVDVESDHSHGMVRDEVVCHSCGGHLGHVFDDGPPPTGKRYCMNGVAMTFVPDAGQPKE
jgi:peptide-methionine (R)-S-oxide reductase